MSFSVSGRLAARAWSRERVLWAGAICIVVAAWAYVFWAFRGQPGDDPYITYRYAYNLASGHGFVFNPGERVQSTTTPLLTLLLAAVGLLGIDIPTFGYLFSQLCLLGFAVVCVRLVSLRFNPWYGLGAVLLTFVSQVTTFGLGGEMPLLMVLAWGSWLAAARSRWLWAAALAGLAAVTRGDGVLVGVALALVFVWTRRWSTPRTWPWSTLLVYAVVTAPWYIFAWFYFGSPLPATFGAKLAQGSTQGAPTFLDGLSLFWFRAFGDFSWIGYPLLIVLVVGLIALIRSGSELAPPWVWALLFAGSFSLLHLPRYPWYYSPLVPVVALMLVVGGASAGTFLGGRLRHSWGAEGSLVGAACTLAVAASLYLLNDVQSARPVPTPRSQMYVAVGDWVRANLPQNASLGADEVGLLGYYSQRRIIDFVGLIQPEVAPHRAQRDFLWVMRTYQPDYIMALPSWMLAFYPDPWVHAHYSPLRTFEGFGSESGQPLVGTLLKRTP